MINVNKINKKERSFTYHTVVTGEVRLGGGGGREEWQENTHGYLFYLNLITRVHYTLTH